jgi:hypothetical protein
VAAPKLISRADLARLGKVSRPYVTNALKGPLAAARVGDRVDLNAPVVQLWLTSRKAKAGRSDGAPTKPPRKAKKPPVAPAPAPTPQAKPKAAAAPDPTPDPPALPDSEEPPSIEEVDAFRSVLGPLAARFATRREFKDWLAGLEGLERYRKQRLDNDERAGRVILRELLQPYFFGPLDSGLKRLLSDGARAIATDIYALAKAGAPIEDAERAAADVISSQFEPVKEAAIRALRHAT